MDRQITHPTQATERDRAYTERIETMLTSPQGGPTGRLITRSEEAQLEYWPKRGHRGAYLLTPGQGFDVKHIHAFLAEIAPLSQTGTHRHTNEALIYILSGSGFSDVESQRIDWKAGDALFVPINRWHRHSNPNTDPVRYLGITTAPMARNLGFYEIVERDDAEENVFGTPDTQQTEHTTNPTQ